MKKSLITLVVAVAIIAAIVWSSHSASVSQTVLKVGVSQITSHPVFDDIRTGIVTGFANAGYVEGKNISFDFENAEGDPSINLSIAQKFASSDDTLFMPLGTPSSQALVNLVKDRPIVFGAVTDPVSAGLVSSNEHPGGNVTGTSDITLYKQQLELLLKIVPNAKTVGIVYNPGEANARYALDQATSSAKDLGLTIVTAPANNSGEIIQAARSIVNKVDAFYMLPDNTVLSGQEALITVCLENNKPLITIDQSGVAAGGLATLGTNYEKVGERTAEIAVRILKGENPGDIPVLGVTDADIFVNLKTAKAINVTIPDDIVQSAKQVYQ